MEPPDSNPVLWTQEINDVTYGFTATTFTKTSRLGFKGTRPDGTPYIWFRKFNHERITNEAKALKLVSQQTSIPVPKLLYYVEHPDGRRGCSMAIGEEHTQDTPCGTCWKQASMNALQFIENTVLPQLAKMTSHQRGIDGFVMPPAWLSPDMSPPWKGKDAWETLPLAKPDYFFQHGDLASHKLMMDPETLQPTALIDWEFAGNFPPGMEDWLGSLDPVVYRNRHSRKSGAIAEFLPAEYLKCNDKWDDKAELLRLIEAGELPDPDPLSAAEIRPWSFTASLPFNQSKASDPRDQQGESLTKAAASNIGIQLIARFLAFSDFQMMHFPNSKQYIK